MNIDQIQVPKQQLAIEYRPLMPKVYKLIINDGMDTKKYGERVYLREDKERFSMPSKLYGDYLKQAYHIFHFYETYGGNVGALFVGDAGTGKTLLSEIIANMAIDKGMPVIYCPSNTDLTEDKALELIASFDNVCLLLDEFGKACRWYSPQNKFLSMLTDRSKNNLWLFTENDIGEINRFMLHRPGRIRYLINFNKVPYNVVNEYCKDFKVNDLFLEELLDAYNEATTFSFDYLQAIVSEHLYSPESTFDDIVSIMNIKSLVSNRFLVLSKVQYLGREIFPFKVKENTSDDKGDENNKDEQQDRPGPMLSIPPQNLQNSFKEEKDESKIIGNTILRCVIDLSSTRFTIGDAVSISSFDNNSSSRRGGKTGDKVRKVLINSFFKPSSSFLEDNKLSIPRKAGKNGFNVDKQLFTELKNPKLGKPLVFIEPIRNEHIIKLSNTSEVKDINDKDFNLLDFLNNPFVYGDKSKGIPSLSTILKDKQYDFRSSDFEYKFDKDSLTEFDKFKFIIKNRWFRFEFCLVDEGGIEI